MSQATYEDQLHKHQIKHRTSHRLANLFSTAEYITMTS